MVLLPQAERVPLTSDAVFRNQILASLPEHGLDSLRPHLESTPLPVREVLETPDKPIEHIVFPVSAITSVVTGSGDDRIEVGLIGRDGMTGISVVLGAESSPHECFVQVPGDGLRIAVADFNAVLEAEPALHRHFLLYARSFLLQTAQTALANGRCTIEERLARWLLMCQDRLGGNDVPLTHEFLSLMLGVRRPGVTMALQALEAARLIRNTRACITIRDRSKMQEIAGLAYTPPVSVH